MSPDSAEVRAKGKGVVCWKRDLHQTSEEPPAGTAGGRWTASQKTASFPPTIQVLLKGVKWFAAKQKHPGQLLGAPSNVAKGSEVTYSANQGPRSGTSVAGWKRHPRVCQALRSTQSRVFLFSRQTARRSLTAAASAGCLRNPMEDTRSRNQWPSGRLNLPCGAVPCVAECLAASLAFTTRCQRHPFPLGSNQKRLQILLNAPCPLEGKTVPKLYPPPHWEECCRGAAPKGVQEASLRLPTPTGLPSMWFRPPRCTGLLRPPRQWRAGIIRAPRWQRSGLRPHWQADKSEISPVHWNKCFSKKSWDGGSRNGCVFI